MIASPNISEVNAGFAKFLSIIDGRVPNLFGPTCSSESTFKYD